MKRSLSLTVSIFFFFCLSLPLSAFTIRGDKQEIDLESDSITITGHVRAVSEEGELLAGKIVYWKKKKLLQALGKVRFTGEEFLLTAAQLMLNQQEEKIYLSGSFHWEGKDISVTGQKGWLKLKTREGEIMQGKIHLERGNILAKKIVLFPEKVRARGKVRGEFKDEKANFVLLADKLDYFQKDKLMVFTPVQFQTKGLSVTGKRGKVWEGEKALFEGKVQVEKEGSKVQADEAIYFLKEKRLILKGNVYFQEKKGNGTSP